MWPVLAFAVMAVARWGASFSPPLALFFLNLPANKAINNNNNSINSISHFNFNYITTNTISSLDKVADLRALRRAAEDSKFASSRIKIQ